MASGANFVLALFLIRVAKICNRRKVPMSWLRQWPQKYTGRRTWCGDRESFPGDLWAEQNL